jgi:D-tyrosyl-tRNA(Tyr) deacylase
VRAVVQRVLESHVDVEGKTLGKIGKGILVLLGVGQNDTEKDIEWLADKIMNLRIFEDSEDKMNLSLLDIKGEILVISQFTLYGDCRKGRRPSYSTAANPEKGNEYYEKFIDYIERKYNIKVEKGVFQADMKVHLINDGPVTLLLDSEKTF